MWKLIKILLAGIAVSFYFFPFEFTFLPGVNTKMAMAGVGLVLYILESATKRVPLINKDGLVIVVLGVIVSLCGFIAVISNGTSDYAYATYFVSMFVWLGGAYAALKLLKCMYGNSSVELVCNCLIGVCAAQCVIALLIDYIPAFKSIVDTYVVGFDFVDLNTLDKADRLYGIGAGLDVAGTRFSAALVMIAVIIQDHSEHRSKEHLWMYTAAFMLISVVGNMIARTTTVGVVVSLVYLICSSLFLKQSNERNPVRVWKYIIGGLIVIVPVIVYLYYSNRELQDSLRFAFEGFFSLAEKGRWETNSNNILKSMIVFPDNVKTWLIGDGYFDNPYWSDAYYTGIYKPGYYMGTDIGYLRFLFYFGTLGLIAFIIYFVKIAQTCAKRYARYKTLFWILFAINMIIWLKVSTDIFVVFALFLCLGTSQASPSQQ